MIGLLFHTDRKGILSEKEQAATLATAFSQGLITAGRQVVIWLNFTPDVPPLTTPKGNSSNGIEPASFNLLNQMCYTKYYIMEPQTELCLINAKSRGTHKKPNK